MQIAKVSHFDQNRPKWLPKAWHTAMATEENYQENQESENNDPEAAEQKPSRRSQRKGMSVPLFMSVI